jgi:complex iron-sulfur molybdoenzyme family reductase subunit gamma
MTDRTTAAVLALFVTALLTASVFAPAVASGRPANQVPVAELPAQGESLQKPTADAWSEPSAVEVPLSSAPSGVPNAADTATGEVSVRAVRTDERLYVRMKWADETVNDTIGGPNDFADAAAVQVPANTSVHPAIALGSTQTPVNVWYWNAQGNSQEILAGGPGTITAVEDGVTTTATHRDGHWYVVMHRNLTVDGANRTQFRMQNDVDVAFAVWNGANMERSGRHAISEWYHFPLGPEPQGPPFETVLWAVAGLAMVAVLLVTIAAIRRSG